MKTIWVIILNGKLYGAYEDTMKTQNIFFELYEKYGSNVTRYQTELK